MSTLRRPSVLVLANDKISILDALRWVGVNVPEDTAMGSTRKMRCPFGHLNHSDQGVSPALRVYVDSNSAYCFSCLTKFTPVSLAAQAWDVSRKTAAVMLLDKADYKPVSVAQEWAQIVSHRPSIDTAMLSQALATYCKRTVPTWAALQFEPEVAATLRRCLELLDLVHDEEHARMWLDRCKQAVSRSIDRLADVVPRDETLR